MTVEEVDTNLNI